MDINFKPLFEYFDKKFAEHDERFNEINKKFDHLQNSIDSLTKMVQDFCDEHIIMHRRLEFLEAWAKKVSEKIGIPLPE